MKAVSLLQPWASLIVLGHKRIETRSWNTKYRGQLLIHASVGTWKSIRHFLAQEPFRNSLKQLSSPHISHRGIGNEWNIPRGAIIGMVEVADTCTTNGYKLWNCEEPGIRETTDCNDYLHLTDQEEAFGDYSPGRYGWLLSNPVLFPEPIPCKGALSIWNVPEELFPEVEKQIQKAKAL